MEYFGPEYWDKRYVDNMMGWDIGSVSTPLKDYFDTLNDKYCKILIPGAGNAYEAEYLFQKGFRNVWILDWSKQALQRFSDRAPDFPKMNLLQENFFEHHGRYDLIVEQTFLSSFDPSLRRKYAAKMSELLLPEGLLVGVLFKIPLNDDHPPFGGSINEYRLYFEPYFDFIVFEECRNSIPPRQGNELFMILRNKT